MFKRKEPRPRPWPYDFHSIPYPPSIRRWRQRRNILQKELTQLIGRQHASCLCAWERGRKLPTLTNALKLSAAIRVPVELLFFNRFQTIREDVAERARDMQFKFHSSFEVIHPPRMGRPPLPPKKKGQFYSVHW